VAEDVVDACVQVGKGALHHLRVLTPDRRSAYRLWQFGKVHHQVRRGARRACVEVVEAGAEKFDVRLW